MAYNLKIPGWMPENELKTLEQLARAVPPYGTMLEIGSFCGRSSWCWAKSVHPSVTVKCIDIWDPSEHPYHPPAKIGSDSEESVSQDFGAADNLDQVVGSLENFKHFTQDCPNIEAIRGHSPYDFGSWTEKSLDLIYLDGVHHNPIFHDDLYFWYWRLVPGGIFCGDDFARTHPDVIWTVHDFSKLYGLNFTVHGRTWIMQKPPQTNLLQALEHNYLTEKSGVAT